MTNFTDYCFVLSLRTYRHKKQEDITTAEVMSIDELYSCKTKKAVIKGIEPLSGPSSNSNFDELVKELIKNRIIMLSKYISIDQETMKLVVNTMNLKRDGFDLTIL